MVPKNERFELRLDEELLNRVDNWAGKQGVRARAEAVRQLVERGLERAEQPREILLTDGDKLIFSVLRDMCKQL